jgi:hypothetical protein
VILMDLPIPSPLPQRRDNRLSSHPMPYLSITSLPFRRSTRLHIPFANRFRTTPSLGPGNVCVVNPFRPHP